MTSQGVQCPTTDTHKDRELRVPAKLITMSIGKQSILLEQFIRLKLTGSRVNANDFFKGIPPTTAKRYCKRLIDLRWVGFDGTYLFPRAWSRIGYKKKGGLPLSIIPENFSEYLFTYSLKEVTKRAGRVRSGGRAMPKAYPVRYFTKSLNISERTYFRKIERAKECRFLTTKRSYTKIGRAEDYYTLKKNLHEIPIFKCGKYTVVPAPSEIEFKL